MRNRLLPSCIPNQKRDDIKLLPSSDSKKVRYKHMLKTNFKQSITKSVEAIQEVL